MVRCSMFFPLVSAFHISPSKRDKIRNSRHRLVRPRPQDGGPRVLPQPNRVFNSGDGDGGDEDYILPNDGISEAEFIERELAHIEALEELLGELEEYDEQTRKDSSDHHHFDEYDDDFGMWHGEELAELFGEASVDNDATVVTHASAIEETLKESAAKGLENALLQGVVPVCAGVGSDGMPGDFGFDPLGLSEKDLFAPTQQFLLNLLPYGRWEADQEQETTLQRPKALILRDYREAEIRHGRVAMLAAVFWPLQEMLDQFMLPEDQFGPLLFGPVTLPYFPLLMTAIMLLLGYLDIYSQAIKDMDKMGEAFLPGDCFWDPLKIIDGASDRTKRNMQERELFNGRAAMLAFAAYVVEELATGKALVELENNALLLRPVYQVPFVQTWLDDVFALHSDDIFISSAGVEGLLSLSARGFESIL